MDYRKLFLGLYNDFHKTVFYCRRNNSKKVSTQFFFVLYTNISTFQSHPLCLFESFKSVFYGGAQEILDKRPLDCYKRIVRVVT